MKIYIILPTLFLSTDKSSLGYDMTSVCRLSVRNACIVAKRYVVGSLRRSS